MDPRWERTGFPVRGVGARHLEGSARPGKAAGGALLRRRARPVAEPGFQARQAGPVSATHPDPSAVLPGTLSRDGGCPGLRLCVSVSRTDSVSRGVGKASRGRSTFVSSSFPHMDSNVFISEIKAWTPGSVMVARGGAWGSSPCPEDTGGCTSTGQR